MKLLKIKEVEKILGVSYLNLYKKVKSGEIPSTRVGRSIRISSDYIDKTYGNVCVESGREYCLQQGLKGLREDRALELIRQYLAERFECFETDQVWEGLARK